MCCRRDVRGGCVPMRELIHSNNILHTLLGSDKLYHMCTCIVHTSIRLHRQVLGSADHSIDSEVDSYVGSLALQPCGYPALRLMPPG